MIEVSFSPCFLARSHAPPRLDVCAPFKAADAAAHVFAAREELLYQSRSDGADNEKRDLCLVAAHSPYRELT